ncbi:MAG: peptide-methionine (S)-S-oxide reductase MsrA [Planctomycetes bacterium]|nr:peptide-methionine (S)-S-oxide reductase MsrA [Planctomycetota bacterium]
MTKEKATFAAGCFWGVEAAFRSIDGVLETAVGYCDGTTQDPTYEDVCRKNTGHAEAVEVEFDSGVVTYDKLLEAFWQMHNPTTLNRQGPDVGSQYRSSVFWHDPVQRDLAETCKQRLNATDKYKGAIVTEICPAQTFYRAEEYHQRYHEKNGGGACAL